MKKDIYKTISPNKFWKQLKNILELEIDNKNIKSGLIGKYKIKK